VTWHTKVYRASDAGGYPLYVGVTGQPLKTRLLAHRNLSPWWPLMSRLVVESYTTLARAYTREWECIRDIEPAFNSPSLYPPREPVLGTPPVEVSNLTLTDVAALLQRPALCPGCEDVMLNPPRCSNKHVEAHHPQCPWRRAYEYEDVEKYLFAK
jgi:hypothetical protein